MINYELRHAEGVLVLRPERPLEVTDFVAITGQVDTYLEGHGKLHGVLIHAKSFPGWNDFAALIAHLKFLRAHLHRIEKVAVVADGALANVLPNFANHFIHAQVQHFEFPREKDAWDWLIQAGNDQAGEKSIVTLAREKNI